MTANPVSGTDRLVMILREKLRERSRAGARPQGGSAPTPMGVSAIAAVGEAEERPLRRALVQTLLADQLGEGFINDARFQQLVSQVTGAIEEDPSAAALLAKVVRDLRTR
jgi:hypothetical protein